MDSLLSVSSFGPLAGSQNDKSLLAESGFGDILQQLAAPFVQDHDKYEDCPLLPVAYVPPARVPLFI